MKIDVIDMIYHIQEFSCGNWYTICEFQGNEYKVISELNYLRRKNGNHYRCYELLDS